MSFFGRGTAGSSVLDMQARVSVQALEDIGFTVYEVGVPNEAFLGDQRPLAAVHDHQSESGRESVNQRQQSGM